MNEEQLKGEHTYYVMQSFSKRFLSQYKIHDFGCVPLLKMNNCSQLLCLNQGGVLPNVGQGVLSHH